MTKEDAFHCSRFFYVLKVLSIIDDDGMDSIMWTLWNTKVNPMSSSKVWKEKI